MRFIDVVMDVYMQIMQSVSLLELKSLHVIGNVMRFLNQIPLLTHPFPLSSPISLNSQSSYDDTCLNSLSSFTRISNHKNWWKSSIEERNFRN